MSGLGVVRVDMMVPDLYRNPDVWLDFTCQTSEALLGELYCEVKMISTFSIQNYRLTPSSISLSDTALLIEEKTRPPLWKAGLVVIDPVSEAATEQIFI